MGQEVGFINKQIVNLELASEYSEYLVVLGRNEKLMRGEN